MVRFHVTVHCDHPGCDHKIEARCQVDAGAFMPRGVFDVKTPDAGEPWFQQGRRHYCSEHKADAGETAP